MEGSRQTSSTVVVSGAIEKRPRMSVVVPTDGYPALQELLAALRAQTASEVLELVVAAPKGSKIDPRRLQGFAQVRLVEVDSGQSLPAARAAGVRASDAPLVVFAETHSFPEPGWAQALIDRHSGEWAAVGPAILNARPEDPRAWGALFVDYGPWVAPVTGGPVEDLPGHGSAYKRSVLLEYGDELDRMLEAEWNLHRDLRARGYQLYLEPAAATRHLNMNRPIPSALQWMHYSRGLASARCRTWSASRRGLYALAVPAIFLVRLGRTLRDVRRARRLRVLAQGLPMIVASLAGSAVGEFAGYVSGATGSSAQRIFKYEVHRQRYVDNEGD